ARCARGLVCNGSGRAHTSIQVTPESPGIPHAMVYGLWRALPGAPGLLATVIRVTSRELDTSVGVPGPHAFSVRISTTRQRHIRVHRIPSRVRDDHDTPLLVGRDGRQYRITRIFGKAEYFFLDGLTNRPDKVLGALVICPSRQVMPGELAPICSNMHLPRRTCGPPVRQERGISFKLPFRSRNPWSPRRFFSRTVRYRSRFRLVERRSINILGKGALNEPAGLHSR